MKCKKLVSLFLSLLLATALAVPACAAFEDVFADGSADGTRDGSLFLSGETVRSSAAVNGVLLAAGRTVGVNGTGAYVMAAGYEVTLGGTAENDAFLAGYSIGVSGTAQRDVFAAGQSITVNGTVGRDLYAVANTVTITGSVGGDWMALGLARSGRNVPDGYYDAVLDYVKANIDENGRLDYARATENARVILALTAIGRDVTDVGGYNLLSGLDSMEYIGTQGVNGPIWALIALDSHDYPTSGDVTREKLVQTILDAALENGGWALTGTTADPDMTAMALQALARYRSRADVSAAVEAGLSCLSQMQEENGAFSSWGTESSESVSQVLTALTELGLSLDDARFVKNGQTLEDVLLRFAQDDGSFAHTPEDGGNLLATTQAFYALTALQRARNGKPTLPPNPHPAARQGEDFRVLQHAPDTFPVHRHRSVL